ncbi:MAG: NnrS family protein [Pseudomonadota bacterium]
MKATSQPTLTTLFSHGFRPLFLLMALYAVIGPVHWLLAWTGLIPDADINAWWHGHEMVMGLAGAAIGGFLLTAVPNWTSTRPVRGLALIALCAAWIGGRFLPVTSWSALISDATYWALLWGLIALPIIRTRNRRNYKVLLVVAILATADVATHIAALADNTWVRQAVWTQLWLVVALVNLIGGRIIPAFTGNWLRQGSTRPPSPRDLPAPFGRIDLIGGLLLIAFALALLTAQPDGLTAVLGTTATATQLLRLYRWKPGRTLSEPLVWMLHLAWAWLAVGTGLWTLSLSGIVPVSAAVHALGIGGIAGMILSVASRATLGHTGRALDSHPLLTTATVMLSLAAISRIIATFQPHPAWLWISGALWLSAFVGWLILYGPMLLKPTPTAGD